MPENKLSRRTFLTAGSALAVLPVLHSPFVRALEPRQTVNIQDYNPRDWIASFKQAFSEAQTVVVPAGLVCENVNTGIFIPAGKTLHVRGRLSGNGRGRFVLQDGCQVTGEQGGSLHNITLDVRGSDCTIRGIAMSGFGPVTQIYIGGKKPRVMRNLTIDDITVSHANYAILRQGFHNQVDGARITNSRFSDLQGDAIEWNVAINDRNILISDHVIERIDCTNGKINWGIGIGLAGSTYDNAYPEEQTVKNFVVANITGSTANRVAEKYGVRYLGLTASRLPGKSLFSTLDDQLSREISSLIDNLPELSVDKYSEIKNYIDNIQNIQPDYMKNNGLSSVNFISKIFKKRDFTFITETIRQTLVGKNDLFQVGNPLLKSFYMNFREVKRWFCVKRIKKLFSEDLTSQPFYLYPLHYHPESSTSILAKFYDEYNLIRNLSFSLPHGKFLVVKDHISATGYEGYEFYKKY